MTDVAAPEAPPPPAEGALRSEIERLGRELRLANAKLRVLGYVLALPLVLLYRAFFGRRVVASVEALREEVLATAQEAGQAGRFEVGVAIDGAFRRAPRKVYDLIEALFLWRFRSRITLVLVTAAFGAIPSVLLYQQNRLVGQQTEFIAAQVRVAEDQSKLLRTQNDIESHRGHYEAFFELHHAERDADRLAATRRLLDLAEHDFTGAVLRGEFGPMRTPNFVGLGPSAEQIHGVYGDLANALTFDRPAVSLERAVLARLDLTFGRNVTQLSLARSELENCRIRFGRDGAVSVTLRGAILQNVTLEGSVDTLDLTGATLVRCHLPVRWAAGKASFAHAVFINTSLTDDTHKDDEAKRSHVDVARLATAATVERVRGLSEDQLRELRGTNEALMGWWEPK